MLIKANYKFIKHIFNSWHYLNCPTHMLNNDLHTMYRQGLFNGKSLSNIEFYLRLYGLPKPALTALALYEFYQTISTPDFNKLNVNSYVDNTPAYVDKLHVEINAFFENTREYYWNGIYKGCGTYVFKNKSPYCNIT